MNHIYSVLWNRALGRFCVTSELGRSRSRATTRRSAAPRIPSRASLPALAVAVALAWAMPAWSQALLPQGHNVVAGSAQVTDSGSQMVVRQGSDKAIVDWNSFNIGVGSKVTFQQPNAGAVALNRVVGADASAIHGQLSANGKVFLVNPNGVLFGQGANVNVGGLVASTLNISNENFLKGNYQFNGLGAGLQGGAVINQGRITAAEGGAVALLGGTVSNQGAIAARLGSVALAAGNQVELDFAGDGLLNVQVSQSAVNALAENQQLLQADGGSVLIAAKATDALLQTVVNNTGTVQARTAENREGKIVLLGGFDGGTAQVAGTLDASAPRGGNGGFIETSGAHVQIADSARVTSQSARGRSGSWLIDPNDFTIAAGGGNMTGRQVEQALQQNGSFTIETATMGTAGGHGDIHVNENMGWGTGTLQLNAERDVNINAVMSVGGDGKLDLNYGGTQGQPGKLPTADSNLKVSGRVDFTRAGSGWLRINGHAYTLINSLDALQGMGKAANLGGKYALGSSIDARASANWNENEGFVPIGQVAPESAARFTGNIDDSIVIPFTGVFDGLGHTISGLTIKRPDENAVGLFGITENATLRNVGLLDISVQGANYVGGLVGRQGASGWGIASISNAHAIGTVQGNDRIGGLVGDHQAKGMSSASMSEAYVAGTVKGQWNVGGLVGSQLAAGSGEIHISKAHANVNVGGERAVGGLAGSNTAMQAGKASISMAYATGNVEVQDDYDYEEKRGENQMAGGLVGLQAALDGGRANIANVLATGGVKGPMYVGGLVGRNEAHGGTASISNAYASGSIESVVYGGGLVGHNLAQEGTASISRSYAIGEAIWGLDYIGGLVGYNEARNGLATIVNAHAAIDVEGDTNAGGLVGMQMASERGTAAIDNAYALGAVYGEINSGGLVGAQVASMLGKATIFNSYASGRVDGTEHVGGLVGTNAKGFISNAYWNSESTGQAASAGGGTALTTAQMFETHRWGSLGFGTVWGNANGQTTPYLLGMPGNQVFNRNDVPAAGTIAADNRPALYTAILHVTELQAMQHQLDGKYVLGTDIDASDTATWDGGRGFAPIGSQSSRFTGIFDGLGHAISGLTIHRPEQDHLGLFGAAENAALRNVRLEHGSVTGKDFTGALVGAIKASAGSTASIFNVVTTVGVTGQDHVGGLAGRQESADQGNASIADVHALGRVAGRDYVGGLVGTQDASNAGTASIADASAYSVEKVWGRNNVGGLIGAQTASTGGQASLSDSRTSGAVRGDQNVGRLIGRQQTDGTGSARIHGTDAVVFTAADDSIPRIGNAPAGDAMPAPSGVYASIEDAAHGLDADGDVDMPPADACLDEAGAGHRASRSAQPLYTVVGGPQPEASCARSSFSSAQLQR